MRKRDYCICENKGADQPRSNCEADQRLCFCYTDSTIPLLSTSKISSFQPSVSYLVGNPKDRFSHFTTHICCYDNSFASGLYSFYYTLLPDMTEKWLTRGCLTITIQVKCREYNLNAFCLNKIFILSLKKFLQYMFYKKNKSLLTSVILYRN